jgi:CBS domain-containing protein
MLEKKISSLPVVENEKVAGIITESDIFRLVVQAWGNAG